MADTSLTILSENLMLACLHISKQVGEVNIPQPVSRAVFQFLAFIQDVATVIVMMLWQVVSASRRSNACCRAT